jgi:hypothetical protein
MTTIHKFETIFENRFHLSMPKDARVLNVDLDRNNVPCVWAMVDTDNDLETRYFELFGTGHEIHVDMGIEREYIGSYRYQNGEFIGHLFERIN